MSVKDAEPFRNVAIDACWMHRTAKEASAPQVLAERYPELSGAEIAEAIETGGRLNMALWELSEKHWAKEIDPAAFERGVRAICPDLTAPEFEHLFQQAMFDSR